MRALLLLAGILAAAAGVFVIAGRPATERLRSERQQLLASEQRLRRAAAETPPVPDDALAALSAEVTGLAAAADADVAMLILPAGGQATAAVSSLDDELALCRLPGLGLNDKLTVAVRAQGEASAASAQALAAIVHALAHASVSPGGLEVEALSLRNDGQLQTVPAGGLPADRLGEQLEAQVVVRGGLPEALACLEALAPQRGGGAAILTVASASLRRIEPERWGNRLESFSGPPVRLSVSVAVLLAQRPGRAM